MCGIALCYSRLIVSISRCTLIHQLTQASSGLSDDKVSQIQDDFSARVTLWSKAAQTYLGTAVNNFLLTLSSTRQAAVLEEVKSQEDLIAKTFISQV